MEGSICFVVELIDQRSNILNYNFQWWKAYLKNKFLIPVIQSLNIRLYIKIEAKHSDKYSRHK